MSVNILFNLFSTRCERKRYCSENWNVIEKLLHKAIKLKVSTIIVVIISACPTGSIGIVNTI